MVKMRPVLSMTLHAKLAVIILILFGFISMILCISNYLYEDECLLQYTPVSELTRNQKKNCLTFKARV